MKKKTQKKEKNQEENDNKKNRTSLLPNISTIDIIAITTILAIFGYIYISNINAYDSLMYDEAGYITMGRTLAVEHFHGIDVQETKESYRQPFFPMMIAASFIIFGISYTAAKIPVIVSALLTMIVIYLIVSKIYDRKKAFFSAVMFGGIPLTLKYVENILSDIPSVLFYALSMFSFYLAIEKKEPKYYYIGWLSFGLTFLIRYNAVLIIPSVGLYLLLKLVTKETTIKELLNDKDFIKSPLAALIPLLPYFLYQELTFGDAFIGVKAARGALNMTWGQGPWYTYLVEAPGYLTTVGFALTVLGIAWSLYKKDKFSLYLISWIIVPLAYFSTQILKDLRLIDTIAPPFVILASLGAFNVLSGLFSRDLKIDNDTVSLTIASILLIAITYTGYNAVLPQFTQVHALGYPTLAQAGEWIKENTPADSVLMTASEPGHQWYSYRKTTGYPASEVDFRSKVTEKGVDYIVIDNYERMQPSYVFTMFQNAFLADSSTLRHAEDSSRIIIYYDQNYRSQTIIIPADLFLERLDEVSSQ